MDSEGVFFWGFTFDMASINGTRGDSLTPGSALTKRRERLAAEAVRKERAKDTETTTVVRTRRTRCACCNGIFPNEDQKSWDKNDSREGKHRKIGPYFDYDLDCCHFCNAILSCSGNITWSWKQALDMLERVRNDGNVMLLKTLNMGEVDITVELNAFDVFKPARVGAGFTDRCSKEHSKAMLTIDVDLGPVKCVLWPWEVSGITFIKLLELQKSSDYQTAFVCDEDKDGYWTLTPKAREMVENCFGKR